MNSLSTNDINYLVCVRCSTFNHAPYIEDAMNGFCMQQTDFPFVCAIIDDASTDGEQEVIRHYLQEHFELGNKCFAKQEETDDYILTSVRHKTNHNCFFAVYYLKYNHYNLKKSKDSYIKDWQDNAKYFALCEGDDYWIDTKKLQKQVNFLDTHLEYGMVYTKVKSYDQSKKKFEDDWGRSITLEELVTNTSPIPTLSVCFRRDLYNKYCQERMSYPHWQLGDVPTWLYFFRFSKIFFLKDVTGVYRILNESASHSNNFEKRVSFINSAFNCRAYMAERYWNKSLAKKVTTVKINNLLYLSFASNHRLKQPILKDLLKYRIKDLKLYILLFLSQTHIGRSIIRKHRFNSK